MTDPTRSAATGTYTLAGYLEYAEPADERPRPPSGTYTLAGYLEYDPPDADEDDQPAPSLAALAAALAAEAARLSRLADTLAARLSCRGPHPSP